MPILEEEPAYHRSVPGVTFHDPRPGEVTADLPDEEVVKIVHGPDFNLVTTSPQGGTQTIPVEVSKLRPEHRKLLIAAYGAMSERYCQEVNRLVNLYTVGDAAVQEYLAPLMKKFAVQMATPTPSDNPTVAKKIIPKRAAITSSSGDSRIQEVRPQLEPAIDIEAVEVSSRPQISPAVAGRPALFADMSTSKPDVRGSFDEVPVQPALPQIPEAKIGIPFIDSRIVTAPSKVVVFEFPFGDFEAKYHHISHDTMYLVFMFDTRYEGGNQFVPKERQPFIVAFPDEDKRIRVIAPNIRFRIGKIDCFCLAEWNEPEAGDDDGRPPAEAVQSILADTVPARKNDYF